MEEQVSTYPATESVAHIVARRQALVREILQEIRDVRNYIVHGGVAEKTVTAQDGNEKKND